MRWRADLTGDLNRVLDCSSFTPFIVVFLHAIATTSMEDVQLLNDVVELLKRARGASRGSQRLYQICAAFVQLARGIVETRDPSTTLPAYNQQQDSLHFSDDHGQMMSIFGSDSFQASASVDWTAHHIDWEAQDISTILASWASGEQSAVGMFDLGNQ